ncbi:MAG: nickel pincer cofactor biosynthesis protein LarB [Pseudanabaena sp. ELA607]
MTNPMQEQLIKLLQQVADGVVLPTAAAENLKHLAFEAVGDFAKIDHQRTLRTGFPEVVFGIGKTPEQIAAIMQAMQTRHHPEPHHTDDIALTNFAATPLLAPLVMATKITAATYAQIQPLLREVRYFPLAQICCVGTPTLQHQGTVTIITAGTADLPIAEEAAVTAELCGFKVQRLWDVGVAGIQRLLSQRHVIAQAEVIIVVAGMEGALASIVGGLADCPVIAVPTSVGYGASFQGLAPLLTMLNSCAAGVGVVNIDNGFGAAMLAGQILRLAYHRRSP